MIRRSAHDLIRQVIEAALRLCFPRWAQTKTGRGVKKGDGGNDNLLCIQALLGNGDSRCRAVKRRAEY